MSTYREFREVEDGIDVVSSSTPDATQYNTWLRENDSSGFVKELSHVFTLTDSELVQPGTDTTDNSSQNVEFNSEIRTHSSPVAVDEETDEVHVLFRRVSGGNNMNDEHKISSYNISDGTLSNEYNVYDKHQSSNAVSRSSDRVTDFRSVDGVTFIAYENENNNNIIIAFDSNTKSNIYVDDSEDVDGIGYLIEEESIVYFTRQNNRRYFEVKNIGNGSNNNVSVIDDPDNQDSDRIEAIWVDNSNSRVYYWAQGIYFGYWDPKTNRKTYFPKDNYQFDRDNRKHFTTLYNSDLITVKDEYMQSITPYTKSSKKNERYDLNIDTSNNYTIGNAGQYLYGATNTVSSSLTQDDVLVYDTKLNVIDSFSITFSPEVENDKKLRRSMHLASISENGKYFAWASNPQTDSNERRIEVFEATQYTQGTIYELFISDGNSWHQV